MNSSVFHPRVRVRGPGAGLLSRRCGGGRSPFGALSKNLQRKLIGKPSLDGRISPLRKTKNAIRVTPRKYLVFIGNDL